MAYHLHVLALSNSYASARFIVYNKVQTKAVLRRSTHFYLSESQQGGIAIINAAFGFDMSLDDGDASFIIRMCHKGAEETE